MHPAAVPRMCTEQAVRSPQYYWSVADDSTSRDGAGIIDAPCDDLRAGGIGRP